MAISRLRKGQDRAGVSAWMTRYTHHGTQIWPIHWVQANNVKENQVPHDIPTDRELEALKILWQNGEAKVREVYDAMNAEGADLAYTTVLSLLQVMEQKGLVGHRLIGKANIYFPNVERIGTLQKLAAGFLERVFDGALDEYIVHAFQSRRLSVSELDRLENMIQEAKQKSKAKGKKRLRK